MNDKPYDWNENYYVFSHFKHGWPVYERTCDRYGAIDRVKELRRRGHIEAFFVTRENMPEKFWY